MTHRSHFALTTPRRYAARGGFTLPFAVVVVACVLMLLAGWTAASTAQVESFQAKQRLRLLHEVKTVLDAWYRTNLARLDGPVDGSVPSPSAALAGFPLEQAVSLGLSDLLPDTAAVPSYPSRVVLAWIATTPRPAHDVFDPQSGRLLARSPDTQSIEVDGHLIEREARRQAEQRLQKISAALEIWFRARVQNDPLHRLDHNYFLPADPTCSSNTDELPCVPSYQAAETLPFWHTALGLSAAELQSPWGPDYPLELSNGEDASLRPPFSVALRFRAPGGTPVAMRAVEPGP